jgi:hypothetical protein
LIREAGKVGEQNNWNMISIKGFTSFYFLFSKKEQHEGVIDKQIKQTLPSNKINQMSS